MVDGREIDENKVSTGEVEAQSTFKTDVSMPSSKDFADARSNKQTSLPSEFGSASGFQLVDSDKSAHGQKAQNSENHGLSDKAQPAENKKAADDKSVKPLDKPDYSKLTPEQKAKEAKDIAKEVEEKGLTDRATRDHLRSVMLQAYLGGDLNSKGDVKAMNDVIKQVNENLPKGQQLKISQPANDPDYAKFMDQSNALIAKNPAMQLGAHGQIQFVKTGADGKEQLVAKTHFAASLRKPQ